MTTRNIIPLDSKVRLHYCNNAVTNTKYSLLTFIPLNLFEQFSRPLNCYFLFVACLQFISIIAPNNPLTLILPLAIATLIAAIKAGYDDLLRYRVDHSFNTRCYDVVDKQLKKHTSRASEDIRVGDVVRLCDGQEAPCDLLLLWSSSEDGVAYIRTDNLDGEIDLKARTALSIDVLPRDETAFVNALCSVSDTMCVECAPPDNRVYVFDSALTVGQQKHSLSAEQFIPQSCYIKKTACIYAVAVYTGNETKVCKSKQCVAFKRSFIDRHVDCYVVAIFCLQILIACVFGILGVMFDILNSKKTWVIYHHNHGSPLHIWFVIPARFFLLTSIMIPISFKVIIDISKFIIANFITWDVEMYDETSGPAVVSNTAISEDLGQVRYILTDKTGTLTQNVMIFRACSVAGHMYGYDSITGSIKSDIFDDPDFQRKVQRDKPLRTFFEHMALCHAASVTNTSEPSSLDAYDYQSSSPDEECLVKMSARIGCCLVDRTNKRISIAWEMPMTRVTAQMHENESISVRHQNVPIAWETPPLQTTSSKFRLTKFVKEYEIMEEFAFTSTRKRMSIILRDTSTGELHMLIKGSDDRIFPRIEHHSTLVAQGHVNAFAALSLRTLVMASRTVTQQEFDSYRRAKAAVLLEIHQREEKLDELYDSMEKGFEFVGASAIEDLLQEDVQHTIRALRDGASIGIWMLTGDKYETALQIAHSCAMIGVDDSIVSIRSASTCVNAFFEIHSLIASGCIVCAIIEGGPVLDSILESEEMRFIGACLLCRAVVCCRMSPKQKAIITGLVKRSGHITLSIGDGGNDVPMIQEAHIGVGIRGKEGSHASRAADFSIGKFRFLLPLLLVHGHYSYMRTSYIVQYSFYKSMLIACSQLMFNCFTFFSGMSYWNSFQLALWNGLFTLPPSFAYTLDRSLPRATLLKYPSLYRYAQNNGDMNAKTFAGFLLRGILQAVAGVLLSLWVSDDELGYLVVPTVTYTAYMLVQTLTLLIESNSITWINHVAIWSSVFLYLTLSFFSDAVPIMGSTSLIDLFTTGIFFVTVVGFVSLLFTPLLIFKACNWRCWFCGPSLDSPAYKMCVARDSCDGQFDDKRKMMH